MQTVSPQIVNVIKYNHILKVKQVSFQEKYYILCIVIQPTGIKLTGPVNPDPAKLFRHLKFIPNMKTDVELPNQK